MTRAYDEATQYRIRGSGPRSATRRCGRALRRVTPGRVASRRSAVKTYTNPVYAYERSPDQDARTAARPVIVVGAGPVGLAAAIDLAQRDVPGRGAGRRPDGQRRLARDLLGEAHARDPRPPGLRRARRRARASSWNVGKVFFQDELVYRVRPAARARAITGRRSSICSSITSRSIWSNALAELPSAEIRWHDTRSSTSRRRRDGVGAAHRHA